MTTKHRATERCRRRGRYALPPVTKAIGPELHGKIMPPELARDRQELEIVGFIDGTIRLISP
jgi:hypothetical protein